jgi:hypothetical protein
MKTLAIILISILAFFSVTYTVFRDTFSLAFLLYFAVFNIILFIHSVVVPEVKRILGKANNTGQ